jgi:hypothetical protein
LLRGSLFVAFIGGIFHDPSAIPQGIHNLGLKEPHQCASSPYPHRQEGCTRAKAETFLISQANPSPLNFLSDA